MYYVKNTVFLNFTKRQKSMLTGFLKSFVKKNSILSKEDIIDKFIENENYYFEINNPHFEFLKEFLSDDDFIRDLKAYIDLILYELKQKELMRPLIEKQKKFQKEQRKRANDYKMSKLTFKTGFREHTPFFWHCALSHKFLNKLSIKDILFHAVRQKIPLVTNTF